MISAVKSSRRPTSIKKEHQIFPPLGMDAYVETGLKSPKLGPTFPRLAADAPMEDKKSKPKKLKTTAPIINSNI